MLKGKIVVSWVLAAVVLAGLGGCGTQAQSVPESSGEADNSSAVGSSVLTSSVSSKIASTASEDNWFEDSCILNTAFTREALYLHPMISDEDMYTATQKWLISFVKENYKVFSPSNIKANVFHPSKYELNNNNFFTISCSVTFETESEIKNLIRGDSGYTILLQAVNQHKRSEISLIGFVTNQNRKITEPTELVDFLKCIPGYENLDYPFSRPPVSIPVQLVEIKQDFIKAGLPSDISAIKLDPFFEDLRIYDICFFPETDLIGILASEQGSDRDETQTKTQLMVFSAADMHPLYQVIFELDYKSSFLFYNSGEHQLLMYMHSGDGYYDEIYYDITDSGIFEIPREDAYRFRLSDSTYILEEINSLVLEQNGDTKLLLTGGTGIDIIYSVDENYYFYCRLNDTQFAYKIFEGPLTAGGGVYDIETGELPAFTQEDTKYLWPCAFDGNRLVLSQEESPCPYIFEILNQNLEKVEWISDYIKNSESSCFYVRGNTLIVYVDDDTALYLFDLDTKTEIRYIKFPEQYFKNKSGLNLVVCGDFVFLSLFPWPSGGYLFKIPIKR